MLLLTTASHKTFMRWDHPHHGRLLTPRCYDRAEDTAHSGRAWAADNDGYGGFNREPWIKMLNRIAHLPGCLFVVAPDVFDVEAGIGDHAATLELWHEYAPMIRAAGLPAAFVLQNGATVGNVPWDCDGVFIGGCTAFKLGATVARIVDEAKRRGKWAHMGRVNTQRRIQYAGAIGVDSVDGTKWARFRDTYMPEGLAMLSQGTQTRMAI